MGKPLVFMMGSSPAFLPIDRKYARNHMWAAPADGGYRIGFSAYAVKLLGDLHHLEWSATPGSAVRQGGQIGFIEGSKATSDLYAPMTGEIGLFNPGVVADPTLINSNLYDAGWLFTIAAANESLLSPGQYFDHLGAAWPLAQRLLKGQAGRR